MATCRNCGTKLSCGCQLKKAIDGTPCCNNCVKSYNKIVAGVTPTTSTTKTVMSIEKAVLKTLKSETNINYK